MSNMRLEGFDELVAKLEKIGKAGNKVANKGLKEGAKIIVAQQRADGPRHVPGPANGKSKHGADALKVGKICTSKSKNKYVQIGITDASVWEFAQGVYFLHHGFHNTWSGKYIAGTQWMTKSFDKSKNAAAAVLVGYLKKELDF